MKMNDWLLQIGANIFPKKEDLEAFASNPALKDVEVKSEHIAEFDKNYLTRARALSDQEIIDKVHKDLQGKILGSVDAIIEKSILDKLSAEDRELVRNEKNTFLKMNLLATSLDHLSKNDDVKKVSEVARKNEKELREKITTLEDTIKEKDSTFDKKIKDTQLDYAMKNKLHGIELAPEFQSTKEALAELKLMSLKKNYVLQFDEKDPLKINLRQNVEGLIKEVFEGNKLLTLDDVLKKEYEPFTKKSTSGDNPPIQKQEVRIPTDKPSSGATLRDMRRAEAGV